MLQLSKEYSATIVTGTSLLLPESRQIAQLLLDGVYKDGWNKAIVVDNILQKRSPKTAQGIAALIRDRLQLMKPELWDFVAKADTTLASQALLASIVKHSHLIGDFMDQVLRENIEQFKPEIGRRDWELYFETCQQVAPEIKNYSETTLKKIRRITFRILADVQYLENINSGRLTPVYLDPELLDYLKTNHEDYVLRCLNVYS